MKNITLLFALSLICFTACKTKEPVADTSTRRELPQESIAEVTRAEINFSDQETWLLGYFNRWQLTSEPHSNWFLPGYDSFQPGTEALNKLLDINSDDLTIKIIMGTWCPDSRREVPRFLRIIDLWQFPVKNITFIGVDNAKLSPVGEYEKLDIQRVPTFIFYINNIEAGRIIENPKTSLEQDMVNILTRNE